MTATDTAFLTVADMATRMKVSERSIERAAKAGTIPKGFKPTPQAKRLWPVQQISLWEAAGCPAAKK